MVRPNAPGPHDLANRPRLWYNVHRTLVLILPQKESRTMPTQAQKPVIYPSLHEMSAQFPPVDWLWPHWIPRGLLTLFGAAPGVGLPHRP